MEPASKPRKWTGLTSKFVLFLRCHAVSPKPADLKKPRYTAPNPTSKPQVLTSLHQETTQLGDKGERASATESALNVIQVQRPHHGSPKILSFYEPCLKKE